MPGSFIFLRRIFFIKEQIKVDDAMNEKQMDELICDIFEIYKEIEIINRKPLKHDEEENDQN